MYSLEEYIRNNSSRLSWITDPDRQIVAVAGLDRAASVLQQYSDNVYPLILIEDTLGGYMSYEAEFLDVSVRNLWIMDKPDNPDSAASRRAVMDSCYRCGKDVLRMMVEDSDLAEHAPGWIPRSANWDRRRTSYMPLQNVGLCYGWMFAFTFIEDISLTVNN
jgi:hypothetical protein